MARKPTQKVRLQEVAQAANVSLTTASNVLSGRRQISTEAGKRVLETAKRMGYMPRSSPPLKKNIRFIIYRKHGLVVMDTPFFSELISGIEKECRRYKYDMLISYLDMTQNEQPEQQLRKLLSDDSMPILLLATEMDEHDLKPFLSIRTPLLVLDSLFCDFKVNVVVMDNREAGRLAASCLIDHGHRAIGFIGSKFLFNNMEDRLQGFSAVLDQHGLPLKEDDIFLVEPTMEGAYLDMREILARRTAPLPTAYFAANDIMAVGCARAMKEAGISLPQQASIIGMDDMPICKIVNPPLSTIYVPKAELGRVAVRRLISMAENNDTLILRTLVGVETILRGSVIRLNEKDAETP